MENSEVCGNDEVDVTADDVNDGLKDKVFNGDEAMGISLFSTIGSSVIWSVTDVGIEDCKILGDSADIDVTIDCLTVGCNEETVASILLGIADVTEVGKIGNKIDIGAVESSSDDGIVLERLIVVGIATTICIGIDGSSVTVIMLDMDGNNVCGEVGAINRGGKDGFELGRSIIM